MTKSKTSLIMSKNKERRTSRTKCWPLEAQHLMGDLEARELSRPLRPAARGPTEVLFKAWALQLLVEQRLEGRVITQIGISLRTPLQDIKLRSTTSSSTKASPWRRQ